MLNQSEFCFDDQASVEAALKCMRRYNRAMYLSVYDSYIDDTLLKEYFEVEDGAEREEVLENAIGAAAIRCCFSDPAISEENKEKCASRMQREFIAAARAAKVEYLYQSGRLGVPIVAEQEREARLKEIAIVQKATYIDKASIAIRRMGKNILAREGIQAILDTFIDSEPTCRFCRRAVMWTWRLIPQGVKDAVKKTAVTAFEKVANVIGRGIERFEQTKVGQKVKRFMETKVEPVLQKGYEKVAAFADKVKDKVKFGWRKLKSIFA